MVLKIIVVLVAIISVALVVAMFSKNKYSLSREVTINKPRQEVYDYLKLLHNQKAFSKWLSLDPDTEISYKGAADGTSGAILTFNSKDKKAGRGEWEMKRLSATERIDFELRFLAPYNFTANGYFALSDTGAPGETKVLWVYNSGMKWPANFMLLFLDMDKIIGNDIAESLANLKHNLERGS